MSHYMKKPDHQTQINSFEGLCVRQLSNMRAQLVIFKNNLTMGLIIAIFF